MSIYIKNFKTNSIQIKDSIRVSSFFPEGLQKIIEDLVPERNYVLGVTYNTGDSQICISGHSKENETFLEGVCRELEEELCLRTKNTLEPVGKNGMNTFFCINVKDAYLKNNKKVNPLKDNPKRGVVCVFGREKDILLYLAKVRYNPNNDDGIDCIWSTSKENILNYCRIGKGEVLNCENFYYSSFY
tara:strand:- start:784 stop:1344 length:561 start_codon:yes stop_codon:yes gene_type:complete